MLRDWSLSDRCWRKDIWVMDHWVMDVEGWVPSEDDLSLSDLCWGELLYVLCAVATVLCSVFFCAKLYPLSCSTRPPLTLWWVLLSFMFAFACSLHFIYFSTILLFNLQLFVWLFWNVCEILLSPLYFYVNSYILQYYTFNACTLLHIWWSGRQFKLYTYTI